MLENDYKDREFLTGVDKVNGEHRTNKAWEIRKNTYFSFLKKKGLTRNTRLLDIGCGAMTLAHAAVPFFVDGEGDYFACDISRKNIELGLKLLEQKGLALDRSNVCISDQFGYPKNWTPINLAFSNSLFSHLNLNSIYLCLYNLNKIMEVGGTYFSSFILTDSDHDPASEYVIGPHSSSVWADPFSYRPEVIRAVSRVAGFDLTIEEGYSAQHFAVLTKRKQLLKDRVTSRAHVKAPPQPWM